MAGTRAGGVILALIAVCELVPLARTPPNAPIIGGSVSPTLLSRIVTPAPHKLLAPEGAVQG